MNDNFTRSVNLALAHEGGYVNHPEDNGGPTNLGVTQRTLSAHLGRPASIQDVRNLTRDVAKTIYRDSYWTPAGCGRLPVGLDYFVFDTAINSGVSRSVKLLQGVLGVRPDEIVGEQTMAAVRERDVVSLIASMAAERMAFMRRLSDWKHFGKGWERRVMGDEPGVQDYDTGAADRALAMVNNDPRPAPTPRPAPKTRGDVKVTSTLADAVRDPAVVGTIGTVVTGAITAGATDGPIGYALAAVIVIAALTGFVLVLRR